MPLRLVVCSTYYSCVVKVDRDRLQVTISALGVTF